MSDYKQLPLVFPPEVVEIPLSKYGEHAGKYTAIVSPDDDILAELSWYAKKGRQENHTWYAARKPNINGKSTIFYMHRVVMERVLGTPLKTSDFVDHIDGNGLNNSRPNLRIATQSQNMANSKKRKDNKSGFKGVYWFKAVGKWRAEIQVDGQKIHLGYFDTPEDAYAAYCEVANDTFGEFSNNKLR